MGLHIYLRAPAHGCSSATTLTMKWLEFGGQEFSKRPDMICQSSGHSRCSVVPLGLDQSRGMWCLIRQRHTQTHVRPCAVIEGLKEDHAPPHLDAILTEVSTFADKRRQSMTQGEVETFKQTRADREPEFLQAFGPAAYPVDELLETALLLVLDHLAVDQRRVGLLDRLLGASRLARAWKGLQGMGDFDQR